MKHVSEQFSGLNSLEKSLLVRYFYLFSIDEIAADRRLQWIFGGLLLYLYVAFSNWMYSSVLSIDAVTHNAYSCWPFFQSCGDWYFLRGLPYGYSQPGVYMFFFAVMLLIVYLMARKQWLYAHLAYVFLFVWEVFYFLMASPDSLGNFDYYHLILSLFFLFSPHKLFFTRLVFVLCYFLASTIKIHEGWILGTYFTSLQTGLPIFPDSVAPIITNIVIFMQIVGCWFLLSNKTWLQRSALAYFVVFHLYSGLLVGYRYPTIALVMLLLIFAGRIEHPSIPFTKKSMLSWGLIAVLFALQFISIAIPGDAKLTLEGNNYGLYMFEANHQCVSKTVFTYVDGRTENKKSESPVARNRCNPYSFWFNLHQVCQRDPSIQSIRWTFDHSVNGRPFYRIVDTENACTLRYKAFSHNDWIHGPKEAVIVGRPVKNIFR